MINGRDALSRGRDRDHLKRASLAVGCAATALIAIVGCSTVTSGTATPDTRVAPAYRTSISLSASASSVTASARESQRQQTVTTSMVRTSCTSLGKSSKDAIDKVNSFVATFNAGKSTQPVEGPAIDALTNSANTVADAVSDALSPPLRDAFGGYADAARAVASAISGHAPTAEFNRRVDSLNDAKNKALKLCMKFF